MKTIECDVCGKDVLAISTGVCVRPEVLIGDTLWDYANCPNCGCQILLKRRYRDVNDCIFPMSAEPLGEDGDGDG